MSREIHVRFCEGLGVQFPRATRLVCMTQHPQTAKAIEAMLRQRFEKFGLTLCLYDTTSADRQSD